MHTPLKSAAGTTGVPLANGRGSTAAWFDSTTPWPISVRTGKRGRACAYLCSVAAIALAIHAVPSSSWAAVTPSMCAAHAASPASAASAASGRLCCKRSPLLQAPPLAAHVRPWRSFTHPKVSATCKHARTVRRTTRCAGSNRGHSRIAPARSKTKAGRCACHVKGMYCMPARCSDAARPLMQRLELIRYLGFASHKRSSQK